VDTQLTAWPWRLCNWYYLHRAQSTSRPLCGQPPLRPGSEAPCQVKLLPPLKQKAKPQTSARMEGSSQYAELRCKVGVAPPDYKVWPTMGKWTVIGH
jgi:hypothetical protein